jgi:hypothetical protein
MADDDAPKPQLEDDASQPQLEEKERPSTEATPKQEESEPAPAVTERASGTSPLAAEESEASSTATETPSELGQVAKQLIPHILNLYNSCPTAADFDAIYAPNATFEDPLAQAHGVGQIKSAFYAMPKVLLDSTVLKYTVEEEQTGPKSGEIRLHNLQQYKLLQLGPLGHYLTIQSLMKFTVEAGKVVRHEDLWGGYQLWNRHTVRVPLVGRMAEAARKWNMLVIHVLMGFGKDHKTLDKPRDANSVRLMAA